MSSEGSNDAEKMDPHRKEKLLDYISSRGYSGFVTILLFNSILKNDSGKGGIKELIEYMDNLMALHGGFSVCCRRK